MDRRQAGITRNISLFINAYMGICESFLQRDRRKNAVPTGFKSISPRLAVRAGQARSAYPGKPFPKFINSEGVASHSTANHANHAKIKTRFSFVYLAYFAVHSASTPSELFSFCPFTQRSPTASVNAGLKAATALRLVRRAGSPLRPERNLCSHPRHPIPQPRRGGIFRS